MCKVCWLMVGWVGWWQSHEVHDCGGQVIGVIPKSLAPREISGDDCVGEQVVVEDMHTRKQKMGELCDAYVAAPGGLGTLEELLEVSCWSQLGIHDKPIGLLDVDGFFAPLMEMVDKCVQKGFLSDKYAKVMISAEDPNELIDKLIAADVPKGITTWDEPEP